MRLALLTPGFSASEDDWCIPAHLDLVRVLAARHDVTVFTLRYPHHRRPYDVHGACVVPFGGAQVRGLRRLPLYLRALREVVRRSRCRRFDVIHALWAHEPGFLATLAGRLTGTPSVVSILGGELVDLPEIDYGGARSAANRFFVQRALRWANRVTVGSEHHRRIAASRVNGARLSVRALGPDTGRFRPGPLVPGSIRLDGAPKLLHVASLVPVKDQASLLRAFAVVTSRWPDARLHVVGDGELRPELERQAARLGINAQVTFHGAVSHDLMPDFYRQADLMVLSSLSEGMPLAVLEAAACGCPVAGTQVAVPPDLGRSVPAGDAEALGELVLELLDDRGSLAARAHAAADRVRSQMSLDACTDAWVRTYREASSEEVKPWTGHPSAHTW